MPSQTSTQCSEAFIHHLRQEAMHHKEKRASFIIQKLAFTIGLFGIGTIQTVSLGVSGQSLAVLFDTIPIAFALPVIALAYDVYIYAEHYRIKRVSKFILGCQCTDACESRWETFINQCQEPLAVYASSVLTLLTMIPAFPLRAQVGAFFWYWLVTMLILTAFVFLYYQLLCPGRLKNTDLPEP